MTVIVTVTVGLCQVSLHWWMYSTDRV